jgi:hypothetical protein
VAHGGVLTGGRVDGDSGQLLELRGMTGEVRAAPNREKVADWRASPWGRGTATTVVRNTARTAVARSPPRMRGGNRRGTCDARVSVGEGERGGAERR